jgi:PAS domain-containing protein
MHGVISDGEALARLHEVRNRCVEAGSDFDGCLGAILDAAIFLTAADKGTLQLLDPEAGILIVRVQRGFHRPFLDLFSRLEGETALACDAALSAAKRIVVEDVRTSELFAGEEAGDALLAEGVRAVQSTLLMSSSEGVFGTISTHFMRPTRLSSRELHFMDLLARQAADYVQRKGTERLLAAKRPQFEGMTGQVGTLVAQCSRDLRYLFVNKPYADFLGKPVELIVGHSIPKVIGEAAFRVILPYVDRALAGERVEYEAEIPYTDLGLRRVRIIYIPGFDLKGSVWGWVTTIHDITGRRDAPALRTTYRPVRYAWLRACRADPDG